MRGHARARGRVLGVCEQWEVPATTIGCVTEDDRFQVLHRGVVVANLPVSVLVDDCPMYDLEPSPPSGELYEAPPAVLDGSESPAQTLLALLRSRNIASRRPVFEQYDPIVQSRTVRRPDEADAAVLVLGEGADSMAIAVSIDGNGRRVACDPRRGAAEAVYECAANLACVGAEPLGLTNCLNFGNPEKPHVAWQLMEAVEGLAEACETLGVPVVGGTCRSTTRRRPARSSRRRWSGSSASFPTPPAPAGSGSPAKETRSRSSGRSSRRRRAPSWPSCWDGRPVANSRS